MEETDEQIQKFRNERNEHVDRYLQEVVRPLLPHAERGSVSSMGTSGQPFSSATVSLGGSNDVLKGSPYYYNGNLKFIHFTSVPIMINILRESALRMYDLSRMDDPQELSYSFGHISPNISEHHVKRWKKSIFSLSMSEYTSSDNLAHFDNWRLYGKNGWGVGIVLSLPKETQESWINRYLSKVYYSQSDLDALQAMYERHLEYEKRHSFSIMNALENFILRLACFHKIGIYKSEAEVRYIHQKSLLYGKPHHPYDIHVDYHNGKQVTFVKLELDRKRMEDSLKQNGFDAKQIKEYLNIIPQVQIKKIMLGYRYNERDVFGLQKVVTSIAEQNLHYDIPVEQSPLTRFFK